MVCTHCSCLLDVDDIPAIVIFVESAYGERSIVVTTSNHCICMGVFVRPSCFVPTRNSIVEYQFQNDLAQLFSLMSRNQLTFHSESMCVGVRVCLRAFVHLDLSGL